MIPGSGRSPGEGIGYLLQYSWTSLVSQMVKKKKKSACNVGDLGWEDRLEEGLAIFFSWRISMDRDVWRAIVHGVAKSRTPLSN